MTDISLSILDRSHLHVGGDVATALQETIARAKQADRLGFKRFWVSEHHGVPGVAGAAPAVLIAAIGRETSSIRLGSGGVMVPNHQPLVIVEQFGTLDALYPGRIDLGLGRSLGFIRSVRRALRREAYDLEDLAHDLHEISDLIGGTAEVTAYPGSGAGSLTGSESGPQVFVLASSSSAEVAARAGMSLVAGGPKVLTPDEQGETAIDRYRRTFRPSIHAQEPFVILNVAALAADTEQEATDLALSEAWAYVNATSQGAFLPLESPAAVKAKVLTERQRTRLEEMVGGAITGTADQVATRIRAIVSETGTDEVLLSGSFHDHAAALHSDALLATAFGLD